MIKMKVSRRRAGIKKYDVKIYKGEKTYKSKAAKDTQLFWLLQIEGLALDTPCGGNRRINFKENAQEGRTTKKIY